MWHCETCGFTTNDPSWKLCPNDQTPITLKPDEPRRPPSNQITIPRAELEELVRALDSCSIMLGEAPLSGPLNDLGKAAIHAHETAAKFRKKFLKEGK